jgi:hypothetical protein
MVLGETAFCDTKDCKILSWIWTKTLDELLMDVGMIDLREVKE